MTAFKDLGLSDNVLKVLTELGFEKPTEIQERSIPKLLVGDCDFIGLAQTGTGKTAAFGLPLLEHIDPDDKATQALVLSPTRELGKQIAEQLTTFSKYMFKLNVLPVYGGEAITKQLRALKKPQHIIIATPGRLIDLIKRKAIQLSNIKFLVLDEADEMLNMGFKDELDEILSYTPEEKQTWLFSATMPKEIKKIVNNYMTDPLEVRINSTEKVNVNISHQFVLVRGADKSEALCRFIDMYPNMKSVVFCRTRMDTQTLAEHLQKSNYKADAIHGDLSQQQRDRVMKRFKKHDLQLLVATDVAARGIDVNDLTHVFHFTLPDDVSYYTHRSGRTARAGKEGISIAFINGREGGRIRRLERDLNISFEKVLIPTSDHIVDQTITQWTTDILSTSAKGKTIPQETIDKVIAELSGMSKEQLITRLLIKHLDQSDLLTSRDLNDGLSESTDRGGRGGRGGRSGGRGKQGGRYRGSRGGAGRRKSNSGGGRSKRSESKGKDRSKSGSGSSVKKKFGKDKSAFGTKKKTNKYAKRKSKS